MYNQTITEYEKLFFRFDGHFKSEDLEIFIELTEHLIKSDRFDDALACLRLAIFYQPEIPDFWLKLAEVQYLRRDRLQAENAYKEARRLLERIAVRALFESKNLDAVPEPYFVTAGIH